MPSSQPAKKGSKEHNRRISEGLIEYHKRHGKPKKKGLIGGFLSRYMHPDNVKHRNVQKEPELKKAKRAARKAEGDLAEAVTKKLSPEKLQAIRDHFRHVQEQHDQALRRSIKKHEPKSARD